MAAIAQQPSALERFDEIAARTRSKRLVVFLDYDGTLAPIVDHPEKAVLAEGTREAVRRLSRHAFVAILSGRDLRSVRYMVGLGNLYYAGSHGFDIEGPETRGGSRLQHQVGLEFLPALGRAQADLMGTLGAVEGVLVERKRLAVAVHYRNVRQEEVGRVRALVDRVAAANPSLRLRQNNMVLELQPGVDWNKGQAALWLLRNLKLEGADVLAMCLGDDLTDEDTFHVLAGRGVAIVVGEGSRASAAAYRLKNPLEVQTFLERLSSSRGAGA